MFLLILTLILCLTKAFVPENFVKTSAPDYSNDPIYNVNVWVEQLHLQRCALVAIGLKYFAIFVEDEILGKDNFKVHRKYFLGICQQDVLEEWKFCSSSLAVKRRFKCRFKLKNDRFQPRVHRRFCDFKVMIDNKDCKCAPSTFGDELRKVKGFPTCYMPPLPDALCKYNVCGMNQCTPATIEDKIHTVNCSLNCKGDNPNIQFLERPHRSLDNCAFHPLGVLPSKKYSYRYLRGTNSDDEDLDDDDEDEEDESDEDIVLEDNPNDEKPVSTTEELEKDEAIKELQGDALKEVKNATNSKNNCQNIFVRGVYLNILLAASSRMLLTNVL